MCLYVCVGHICPLLFFGSLPSVILFILIKDQLVLPAHLLVLMVCFNIWFSTFRDVSFHAVCWCVCLIRFSNTAVDRSVLIVFPYSAWRYWHLLPARSKHLSQSLQSLNWSFLIEMYVSAFFCITTIVAWNVFFSFCFDAYSYLSRGQGESSLTGLL